MTFTPFLNLPARLRGSAPQNVILWPIERTLGEVVASAANLKQWVKSTNTRRIYIRLPPTPESLRPEVTLKLKDISEPQIVAFYVVSWLPTRTLVCVSYCNATTPKPSSGLRNFFESRS